MSSQTESEVGASQVDKSTIELQGISLEEMSRPRSAQSMTVVDNSTEGICSELL